MNHGYIQLSGLEAHRAAKNYLAALHANSQNGNNPAYVDALRIVKAFSLVADNATTFVNVTSPIVDYIRARNEQIVARQATQNKQTQLNED